MAAMSINRTYGKIAGFWVITQKPLIKTEIRHGLKMISTAILKAILPYVLFIDMAAMMVGRQDHRTYILKGTP
jgi:hypothetical protein